MEQEMRICVCFKVVHDYDQVPKENWTGSRFGARYPFKDAKYVKKVFGHFDEGALEMGLWCDADYVEAVSFGEEDRIFTENLYAAGYDKVTYINGSADFNPDVTTENLAGYIRKVGTDAANADGATGNDKSVNGGFDLVLMGEMVGPNDSGTVPYLVAEKLGWPLIDHVSDIRVTGLTDNASESASTVSDSLVAIRETEDFTEEYELTSPTILVISNAVHPYLRFGLYKDKEAAKQKPANILQGTSTRSRVKLVKPVHIAKNGTRIDGDALAKLITEKVPQEQSPWRAEPSPRRLETSQLRQQTRDVYSGYLVTSGTSVEKPEYTCPLEPVSRAAKVDESGIRTAKVVFVGGRGLGSRTNYQKLKALAEKLGAACGCTRPVAMNGWESYDNFIGISGHILEADLVVTFGVAGAGPFIKGIEKCATIVAINNDKNALIFDYADYIIEGDCMKVIEELSNEKHQH